MITFEHVRKTFDSLVVLDDLDLRIAESEIVGIVGPSGVGKTTILKLITGIAAPDSGKVEVADRRIGYVFQEPRLLPWRTAQDNIAVVMRAQGMSKDGARQEAGTWIERVGLQGFADYYPAELSGGMAQRVSIARAFAAEPRILLMDEPFSNMDLELKGSLIGILQMIARERKTTVVYVTHELIEALQIADRIVELTAERRLRELDLADRRKVALDWLSSSLGRL
ncbi:MAG TPA: ATP-binding cassette domain-containing protein [Thermoleophilia bacterium]